MKTIEMEGTIQVPEKTNQEKKPQESPKFLEKEIRRRTRPQQDHPTPRETVQKKFKRIKNQKRKELMKACGFVAQPNLLL